MMLTLDLPSLFGIMARPANMLIRVKDDTQFDDWLHVISVPIVMRVIAGEDEAAVRNFRDQVVELLRGAYGLTLTASRDCHLLSRNQVNVPISALTEVLHGFGARFCRVSFFGMKWALVIAEPIIDQYIGRYRDQIGSSVPEGMNSFDYGYRWATDEIVLYGFSEAQRLVHLHSDGRVHEMYDMEGFGSIRQTFNIDVRNSRVDVDEGFRSWVSAQDQDI